MLVRFWSLLHDRFKLRPRRIIRPSFELLEDRSQPSVTGCNLICNDDPSAPIDTCIAAEVATIEDTVTIDDAVFVTPTITGAAPILVRGGNSRDNLNVSWSVNASYAFVNMGTATFAIQFDQPLDPASIAAGVNVKLSSRQDEWMDPWTDVAFHVEYDAATQTLFLLPSGRTSFSGGYYRIILGGDSTSVDPLRSPDGPPLGFDDDHPTGRTYELSFLFDDGISNSKNDLSAGPAPAATFTLIAPDPVIVGPAGAGTPPPSGTSTPTNTPPPTTPSIQVLADPPPPANPVIVVPAPNAANNTPARSDATPRLTLITTDPRSIYSAVNHASPGPVVVIPPNFTAPLSAAPVGGARLSGVAIETNGADRLDLSAFITGNGAQSSAPANGGPGVHVWRRIAVALYSWIEQVATFVITLPTQIGMTSVPIEPLRVDPVGKCTNTPREPEAIAMALAASIAILFGPGLAARKQRRNIRRDRTEEETREPHA